MIIDSHAHIYPEKIAKKATDAIGEFYDIEMQMTVGTTDMLIEDGKHANISRFVVHSCATKGVQVHPINEFIKSEADKHKEFIPFMTLHQDLTEEEIVNEVEWCIKNGFKGVKLHPDFQKFNIDDEEVFKFYRAVEGKLPILFHTGDNRFTYSKPYRLASVAKFFPKVNFIGAHFGGYRCWDELDVYKGLKNVFFDTSSTLSFISKEKAVHLIRKFGAEKYFFGTDFPMWDAKAELDRFYALNLTEKEREKILGDNLKNFLLL